jgi:hypothetical protein
VAFGLVIFGAILLSETYSETVHSILGWIVFVIDILIALFIGKYVFDVFSGKVIKEENDLLIIIIMLPFTIVRELRNLGEEDIQSEKGKKNN